MNTKKKDVEQIPIIDAHCDSILKQASGNLSLLDRNEEGHLDIPRMQEENIVAQFFACWISPDIKKKRYAQQVYFLLDELHTLCETSDQQVQLATDAATIRNGITNGTKSVIPTIEGGHAIENSLKHLRNFARLGAKSMTLTWMNNNDWADGSGDEANHHGLTEFGRNVVREMNDLGMIVDVSHTSRSTFRDAVETSRAPVLASHSCCSALYENHRNLTDEQLEQLADNEGA